MGWIWREGSTNYQKIVASIVGVPSVPALAYMLFFRKFRPSDEFYTLSIIVSMCIAAIFITFLFFLYKTNKWKPEPAWMSYSRSKKLMVIIFFPLLVFYFYWMNFGFAFPYLFTNYFGQEKTFVQDVRKTISSSRYSCTHQLKADTLDRLFFEYCVSEDYFHGLPDSSFKAKFRVKESFFGVVFEGVILTDSANKW